METSSCCCQAEVDAMAAELKHTQQLLTQSDNALDRCGAWLSSVPVQGWQAGS